jgi:hypothetical protein
VAGSVVAPKGGIANFRRWHSGKLVDLSVYRKCPFLVADDFGRSMFVLGRDLTFKLVTIERRG